MNDYQAENAERDLFIVTEAGASRASSGSATLERRPCM